jgi:cupin 2 domain-containing protein
MDIKNIFSGVPRQITQEITDVIVSSPTARIERIVSKGHSSSRDYWYDQEQNEWVIVIKGKARLEFYGEIQLLELNEGDYINIPSHNKHRVDWTDPESETIWLAVFY